MKQQYRDVLPPDTKPKIIGYKEPLKKVKKGFGYYGTIAYDETQSYVQCHICGYFFPKLGTHVAMAHGIKSADYKAKYGITLGASLTAPKAREKWLESYHKLSPEEKRARITKLNEARKKSGKKGGWKFGQKKSLQQKNKEGRCPDQLLEKIKTLALMVDKTPSESDCIKIYGYGWHESIINTFYTWNNAVKLAGLKPNPKGGGFRPIYSKEQVVAMIRDFKEQNNREPMRADIDMGRLPSSAVYTRIFGSWTNAKEEALR